MITVDVTYTNPKIFIRKHVHTEMPPLFQSFKVRGVDEIERYMRWPAEAEKAHLAIYFSSTKKTTQLTLNR